MSINEKGEISYYFCFTHSYFLCVAFSISVVPFVTHGHIFAILLRLSAGITINLMHIWTKFREVCLSLLQSEKSFVWDDCITPLVHFQTHSHGIWRRFNTCSCQCMVFVLGLCWCISWASLPSHRNYHKLVRLFANVYNKERKKEKAICSVLSTKQFTIAYECIRMTIQLLKRNSMKWIKICRSYIKVIWTGENENYLKYSMPKNEKQNARRSDLIFI